MYKILFGRVCVLDKTKTFDLIVKFNGSVIHEIKNKKIKNYIELQMYDNKLDKLQYPMKIND